MNGTNTLKMNFKQNLESSTAMDICYGYLLPLQPGIRTSTGKDFVGIGHGFMGFIDTKGRSN
jgi:hypothetical protein